MTQTTGNATMLDRMPMMASSGDRLMKPSESPGLTVGGMVLYHMAFPTMHKNSRAKQVETLWHLEAVMAIIIFVYIDDVKTVKLVPRISGSWRSQENRHPNVTFFGITGFSLDKGMAKASVRSRDWYNTINLKHSDVGSNQ